MYSGRGYIGGGEGCILQKKPDFLRAFSVERQLKGLGLGLRSGCPRGWTKVERWRLGRVWRGG